MENDTLILSLSDKFAKYYTLSNDIVTLSQHINETNLKLLAGIVLLLLGTDKVRPIRTKVRYIYFILFPALIALVYSFYLGGIIQNNSATIKTFKYFSDLKELVKGDKDTSLTSLYVNQTLYMNIGIALVALWLLVYFIWWFFSDNPANKTEIPLEKEFL